MSLTLYVAFVWQFFYEVKSCRFFKNLWFLISYKNCSSKELASREWVSKITNLNLVDIRFSIVFTIKPSTMIQALLHLVKKGWPTTILACFGLKWCWDFELLFSEIRGKPLQVCIDLVGTDDFDPTPIAHWYNIHFFSNFNLNSLK